VGILLHQPASDNAAHPPSNEVHCNKAVAPRTIGYWLHGQRDVLILNQKRLHVSQNFHSPFIICNEMSNPSIPMP
jgi:hypothetical protein